MTSILKAIAVVMGCVCLLTSCLKDSDDITYYDDAAITSVTLGTVTCNRDDGSQYTYSAGAFAIYIDQVQDRIYNIDSLVVKTDLTGVPVTFGTKNYGIVAVQNLGNEDFTIVSTGEAINFSQERVVRVYSNDGNHTRDYKMKIVAHQEYPDHFSWSRLLDCAFAKNYTGIKGVNANGTIYLLGSTAAGYEIVSTADGTAWTKNTMPVASCAAASIAEYAGKLYLLADGTLYTSADAEAWTEVAATGMPLKTIVGGCMGELYAIGGDGCLAVSRDGGATWTVEETAQQQYVPTASMLPGADICFISAASVTNPEVGMATIVANAADAGYENPVVWNKVIDPDDATQQWTFTSMSRENSNYKMPKMTCLSATCYADGILAVGGSSPDKLYCSPDHGATWHTQSGMGIPEGFASAGGAVVIADGKGFVYLIGTGSGGSEAQVWRGRQNKQTWERK